jgi:hypothetical protein
VFGVIAVDPAALDSSVERVSITLPHRVLLRLDARPALPAKAVPATSRI